MSTRDASRPFDVLLVEDDEGDIVITREALDEGHIVNRLSIARDGVEAVDFLRRRNRFTDAPRPDLVLLDLNLPKRSGAQVLEEIKSDHDLRRIPVVVMSTSDSADDVSRSYDLHANAYIKKPVDFNQFVQVIRQIDEFFLTLAELPTA